MKALKKAAAIATLAIASTFNVMAEPRDVYEAGRIDELDMTFMQFDNNYDPTFLGIEKNSEGTISPNEVNFFDKDGNVVKAGSTNAAYVGIEFEEFKLEKGKYFMLDNSEDKYGLPVVAYLKGDLEDVYIRALNVAVKADFVHGKSIISVDCDEKLASAAAKLDKFNDVEVSSIGPSVAVISNTNARAYIAQDFSGRDSEVKLKGLDKPLFFY